MESKSKGPIHLVYFGIFVMILGGFFAVIHVGTLARQDAGMKHGFAFRGGAPAAPAAAQEPAGYASDFKRGSKVVAAKAGDFADSFFSWFDEKPASGNNYASAQGGGSSAVENEEERDPFEEFYSKYYGNSSGGSASSGFGGGSAGSFAASGGSATAGSRGAVSSSAAVSAEGKAAVRTAAAASGGQTSAKPLFGGPLGRAGSSVPPLQASLPAGKKLLPAGSGGGLPKIGANASAGGMKTGKMSGMGGSAAAGDLNDESASMRSGAAGSYKSKMAGGASAAAAAGDKAAPAASAPEKVKDASADGGSSEGGSSGSGSSGSGSSSGSSGSGDAAGPSEEKSAPEGEDKSTDTGDYELYAGSDKAFLETIVKEQRRGENEKYLTDADRKSEIDETALKGQDEKEPGGENKRSMLDLPEDRVKDPKDISQLSAERKLELKKQVHGFLERFGNRFGKISKENTVYTSCRLEPLFCKDNKVTEGFVKATTDDRVTLWLGLKYSERRSRWRPYAIKTDPENLLRSRFDRGHRRHARPPSDTEGGSSEE